MAGLVLSLWSCVDVLAQIDSPPPRPLCEEQLSNKEFGITQLSVVLTQGSYMAGWPGCLFCLLLGAL